MASIFDTVWGTGPQRARRQANGPSARVAPGGDAKRRKRLTEIESFGADPGALRMLAYAPANLAPGAALVVVLHGCTQSAEDYDAQSGWSALADELGFALLYPEQRRANNPAGCFNWFLAADSARGLGEARSIREMVETMIALRGLDRGRIYVTGLSAGGAMAANLLAGYPDVFSAGALIAGLPCGAAANVTEAFGAMSQPAARTDAELGDAVRAGAPYEGPWPRVSIWQGLADRTVAPGNADQLARQWLDVHGAPAAPTTEARRGGRLRRAWKLDGREVVEVNTIEDLGHGAPLDGRRGERPGPFMIDVGVSSTRAIARFFGLVRRAPPVADAAHRSAEPDAGDDAHATPAQTSAGAKTRSGAEALSDAKTRSDVAPAAAGAGAPADDGTPPPRDLKPRALREPTTAARSEQADPAASHAAPGRIDVAAIITKALRTAGLMR